MDRRQFVQSSFVAAGILAFPAGASGRDKKGVPTRLDAAAYHASRHHVSTPFGRIAFVERGRGPAALFIHGFPLSGFQWRGALERLANRRRCLAPDLMGLGYSEVAERQDLSPRAQADMLVAFLDRLSIRAVDLIAVSGGPGWTSRLTYGLATLTGRGSGSELIVSVTGKAGAAGAYGLSVKLQSDDLNAILPSGQNPDAPGHPSEVYRVTALNGWVPAAASFSSSPMNTAVASPGSGAPGSSWGFTGALVAAAAAALVVPAPRRRRHPR